MAIIKKESSNLLFDDLLRTVILPLLSGICFIIWLFYFCKSPVEIFPTILIIFLAVYFLSGYVFGGVFLSFILGAGFFSFLFVKDIYTIAIIIFEMFWIVSIFLFINNSRSKYVNHKKHFNVEYELLDRDISIIKSSINKISKRNEFLKKRMELFKNFEKFITELEQTLKEKEVLKITEKVIKDFIKKGNWKIKKYSSNDVIAKYIKETKTPLLIDDVTKDKRFFDTVKYQAPVSLAAVPIEIDGNFWGIIKGVCDNSKFDSNDLRFLSIISNIINVILNNAILFDEVEALSITDGLTGLYTRRYFFERVKEEINRYIADNIPLVMAMLDLDDFKKINDTYGHLAGDMLLRQIANMLRKRFRELDILARYGGEEFVILISHTDIDKAKSLFEEIRQKIEDEKFFIPIESYNPVSVKQTISIGLTQIKENKNIHDIVKEADTALYKAKKEGKNRVCCFNCN